MSLHTNALDVGGQLTRSRTRLRATPQRWLSSCMQVQQWRLPPVMCTASSSNGSNGNSSKGSGDAANADGSFSSDDASSSKLLRFNQRQQDLPAELQGLQIKDGLLVDEKTGKTINDFGATRFDVAVRAMRGELDPPPWVENTEEAPGVILRSLQQFPCDYMFQVVGKPGGAKDAFVEDITSCIGRVCEAEVLQERLSVKERMGGKFISVALTMTVRAPELINRVYQELGKDPRVIMKF